LPLESPLGEPAEVRRQVAPKISLCLHGGTVKGAVNEEGRWRAALEPPALPSNSNRRLDARCHSVGDPFVYAIRHTPCMSKTVPVREFRTHLAELLDEVADRREHVTVTRHGRPAAVLVPVDEYESLEETAAILSDEDTLAAIRRGLDDMADGDVVTLQQGRDEHAARQR
jgi:antitoxin YefM